MKRLQWTRPTYYKITLVLSPTLTLKSGPSLLSRQAGVEDETALKEAVFTIAAFDEDADGALDEAEFEPWFNTHPSDAYREADQ